MNRLSLVLAGLGILAWSGLAMAQTSGISTVCPVSYSCAFTAAESFAFGTPSSVGTPGQPDAFAGYISFDGSGAVTVSGIQNLNGTVTGIASLTGTCAAGSGGAPATIMLSDHSQISFVTAGRGGNPSTTTPAELDFIQSKDSSGSTSFGVRVGVCRSL